MHFGFSCVFVTHGSFANDEHGLGRSRCRYNEIRVNLG
jgi:hypothetical protein